MKLADFGVLAGGLDDAMVSNRIRRLEAARTQDPRFEKLVNRALRYLEKKDVTLLLPPFSFLFPSQKLRRNVRYIDLNLAPLIFLVTLSLPV
jgi:hypothetical protein